MDITFKMSRAKVMASMAETDWRKILSLSQKELLETDKEELCESLSWMEADDIDLNFSDMKTLFRLAQDIIKYKSEQVKNLLGELETVQIKRGKKKSRNENADNAFETISHQEEVIKTNKDILEQLYLDIAELEGRKSKYNEDKNYLDKDSESSPDVLSAMDTKAHLENEITKKNRHIRKLLGYTKILEDENSKLKEKISILKDKLKEATMIIENLTEQIFNLNNECNRLKDNLGSSEQVKFDLLEEIKVLKEEVISKQMDKGDEQEELKTKVQHLKNIVRTHRAEIEKLTIEKNQLKKNNVHVSEPVESAVSLENISVMENSRIKELGDKLTDASNEILRSASLIEILKAENKQLKTMLKESHDTADSNIKNQSDDGKERNIITKLKKKVNLLTVALNSAEEILGNKDQKILELSAELNIMHSDEGVRNLLTAFKNNKRDLKIKDEEIKSLVKNINKLSEEVNQLHLENETMRRKLNLSNEDRIPTEGILQEYHNLKQQNLSLSKNLLSIENQLVQIELDNREKTSLISKQAKILKKLGFNSLQNAEAQISDCNYYETEKHKEDKNKTDDKDTIQKDPLNVQMLVEENEGLRKGLEEILNFLKDSSASGVLSLECPSLEAVLQALEARHTAGWFAPHMAITMQLKEALGGKDALLSALRQSRKEIFDLMTQLSAESKKFTDLQNKLAETESKIDEMEKSKSSTNYIQFGEFSSWVLNNEDNNVDLSNKADVEKLSLKRNYAYEQEVKNALIYFRNKYEMLYDKMTEIAMRTSDEKNNWNIMEENYKAQIENLKALKSADEDEDRSDISPGLITGPESSHLQRKCGYLEELYGYTRTSYENMKNEFLEVKKVELMKSAKYESHIQCLLVTIVNLTDKLRKSINQDIFWKQNLMLNETLTKYRQLIDCNIRKITYSDTFLELLDKSQREARNIILKEFTNITGNNINDIVKKAENAIAQTQLQELCLELNSKNSEIDRLIKKNMELEETQTKLIDDMVATETKDEINMMKQEITQLNKDNITLRERYSNIKAQLDIVLLQAKDDQQRSFDYETEISMLRHQILDLQSSGDNKAIIARLSNEILMTHLQATEYQRRVENLKHALEAEKEIRAETENAWKAQQRILDMLSMKCDNKFRYMHEVVQILKLQYQGSIPLISAEKYLTSLQEYSNKAGAIEEKIAQVEEMRYNLITKHNVYDQILELTKANCSEGVENCTHELQLLVSEGSQKRELEHLHLKLSSLDETHKKLINHCAYLEKTLIILNQGLNPTTDENILGQLTQNEIYKHNLVKVEDINSDEDSTSKESGTFTLPKPQTKQLQKQIKLNMTQDTKTVATSTNFCEQEYLSKSVLSVNVFVQTDKKIEKINNIQVQTEEDDVLNELNKSLENLKKSNNEKGNQLAECLKILSQRDKNIATLGEDYNALYLKSQNLTDENAKLVKSNENLKQSVDLLRKELDHCRNTQVEQLNIIKQETNEETQSLLQSIIQIEDENNQIIVEYKQLLEKEREDCSNTVKKMQAKLTELQKELDGKASAINISNTRIIKESVSKYTTKNLELEDKCFKLQNSVDDYKTEVANLKSELQRWQCLAAERLEKMEQMSVQLKERHSNEVESYKAENHHWMSQLNETQREHMELRSRLTEQKALHVKQLSEKDNQIDHLRSVIHNLKTQIMSMQTMLSVNDPTFDLSAIVEVEEASDVSQQGSDRLELKFDSTVDLHEIHDDFSRMATSTAIWQEPVIERLRREKQLLSKQNGILRRQIKAVASRERRARLDAQNLKNQIFRISTSGGKVPSAESAALHNKIASLQAQLTSARRDTQSSVALWDKWKRAQQASERWQARYDEKCQEVHKLDASLHLAKSAVARLEKEKRFLMSRLADAKNEKQLVMEKQDGELSEKRSLSRSDASEMQTVPVSTRALLDRIEAQQRRIVALEVAEKGNEPLVAEYERTLAEITSLKGQVLKLESTLLEAQIRSPLQNTQENQPELEYWKSYCDMLKEENAQLTMRANSLECAPHTASQQRVNDLEQTVLTLRGLVSKLQAEQKSSGSCSQKRADSRPSSGRAVPDKTRSQLESCKTEISNLKRSIQEKDMLLENSKDMLRIAAEREDELLSENAFLRRQLEEMSDHKRGSLSA